MLRTNADRLAMLSVIGQVSSPLSGPNPYRITGNGEPVIMPGVGGITYNIQVGDPACGWEVDHVEPGVSTLNPDVTQNNAYNLLSQIGNEARVVSGEAKGAKGTVIGKHGGIEHVMIDFPSATLEKLVIGDKIQVKAFGTRLQLLDYPDVTVMNLDPGLLKKMQIKEDRAAGTVTVPVTHRVPAAIMGSGLGKMHAQQGDYDIQMFDEGIVQEYGLNSLRFGDLVAIEDADNTYGRLYRTGAVTVGVIVHSACVIAGHGPGVATLMTSAKGKILPRITKTANIAQYLKLGRFRPGKSRKKR